jgi:predicted transcriptional regulator
MIDPSDPLAAFDRPLTAQILDATRMTHAQLAAILGVSRPAVTIWAAGKTESFSRKNLEDLKAAVVDQIDALEKLFDELERRKA